MASGVRVAIIGGGVSGLSSIKACLEEGLEPVCYEMHDNIGGCWYYSDETRPDQGCTVYPTLITNSSREIMCFSDYPMPDHYPPYLPHNLYFEYLQSFAKKFNLNKYITFNTKCIRIVKTADYEITGNWNITTQENGKEPKTEIFPRIIVATGFFRRPVFPTTPGIEDYQGIKMHSQAFRYSHPFKDKVVLVVGNSHSAGDASSELSHYAKQVYMSVGRGCWVIPKMADQGIPRDLIQSRFLLNAVPRRIVEGVIKKAANARMNHENYGLIPSCGPLHSSVMTSDEIGFRIMAGRVIVKPYVSRYTTHGAVFEDGTSLNHIDAVVFATGYKLDYTIVDKDIVAETEKGLQVYKFVFPVNEPKHTMGLVGCFYTMGGHPPAMEVQARWVARVFAGKLSLPRKEDMAVDVIKTREALTKQFGTFKLLLTNLDYRDEIAEQLGCKPQFWNLLFRDPVLAFKCQFGTAFPFQYRLQGPNTWDGAKKANDEAFKRTVLATKTRVLKKLHTSEAGFIKKILQILCLGVVFLGIFIKLYV